MRGALNHDRRSTSGEKRRTLDLMQAHLRSTDHLDETLYVQEIRRDQLIAFLGVYANRRGKAALAQEADGAAAPQDQADGKAEAEDADAANDAERARAAANQRSQPVGRRVELEIGSFLISCPTVSCGLCAFTALHIK